MRKLKLSFSLVWGNLCPHGLESAELDRLPLNVSGEASSAWTWFLGGVGQLWQNRSGLPVCCAQPRDPEDAVCCAGLQHAGCNKP